MGQVRKLPLGLDAFGCLRSLRARSALDGVSWVQGGSVEIAVGQRFGPAAESAPSSAPSLGHVGSNLPRMKYPFFQRLVKLRRQECLVGVLIMKAVRAHRPALSARANPRSSPAGSDWLHGVKHDGFRVLAWKQGERVKAWSRRGADFTDRLLSIAGGARAHRQMSARGRGRGRI
jgi:hypothetical protein